MSGERGIDDGVTETGQQATARTLDRAADQQQFHSRADRTDNGAEREDREGRSGRPRAVPWQRGRW